jgi:hypothetical protein
MSFFNPLTASMEFNWIIRGHGAVSWVPAQNLPQKALLYHLNLRNVLAVFGAVYHPMDSENIRMTVANVFIKQVTVVVPRRLLQLQRILIIMRVISNW